MKVIKFEQYGGPEVLQYTEADRPEPGDNEVLVEVKAIGVNYADTARREGQYVVPTPLPYIPGSEAAGVIVATGSKVKRFEAGMRVSALIESGAYADFVTIDANTPVSYTHLRAHETRHDLVCRLLLEKKKYTSPSPRDKRQSRMPSSA